MNITEGWACADCTSPNLFEDRYCGECGEPRDVTAINASLRPPDTVSGILPEYHEPPLGTRRGLLGVAAAGAAAALVYGAVYHGVTRWIFDVIVLFPILLGAAVGATLTLAALKGRFRKGWVLALAAVIAGLAAYGVRQTLETARIQADLGRQYAEGGRPGPGFFQSLDQRADAGVQFGFSMSRTYISGAGFWLLLLAESALAAGVAAVAVFGLSRRPYCARCGVLIPSVPVFRVNGRDSGALTSAVRRQKWKAAKSLSDRAAPTPTDRAEATLLKCPGCDGSSIRVDLYEGRNSKRMLHVALPSESLRELARSA
jgi:hypothetical protein